METRRRTLARRAKEAREAVKLTQVEAASRLSLSVASLAAYEQGSRDIPDATVDALAELYGIHPAVFRYGQDVLYLVAHKDTARRIREVALEITKLADALDVQQRPVDAPALTPDEERAELAKVPKPSAQGRDDRRVSQR